jgi:carbon storage regulator
MLVLSRKKNQSIIINGGEIEIIVVEIRGDKSVRLGIKAPPEMPVHRGEIQRAIDASEEPWRAEG